MAIRIGSGSRLSGLVYVIVLWMRYSDLAFSHLGALNISTNRERGECRNTDAILSNLSLPSRTTGTCTLGVTPYWVLPGLTTNSTGHDAGHACGW